MRLNTAALVFIFAPASCCRFPLPGSTAHSSPRDLRAPVYETDQSKLAGLSSSDYLHQCHSWGQSHEMGAHMMRISQFWRYCLSPPGTSIRQTLWFLKSLRLRRNWMISPQSRSNANVREVP
jgi:hypothetical protein